MCYVLSIANASRNGNQTKNKMKRIQIARITLSIDSHSVLLCKIEGALIILESKGEVIAHVAKGQKARAKLAKWISTLHPDTQLDALDLIRESARLICPDAVSEKSTLELYPQTQIKI
jgi:hypothetical protein